MRRIQQTTVNIRKPIRPNSSSLYATASLEPLQTISRYARRRTRLALLRFVRVHGACRYVPCACAHGVYLLVDHCFPGACTASKARFSLYIVRTCTVYRTIAVSLSVRMRTVRNTNSWLNFRACARNVSPCKVKTKAKAKSNMT